MSKHEPDLDLHAEQQREAEEEREGKSMISKDDRAYLREVCGDYAGDIEEFVLSVAYSEGQVLAEHILDLVQQIRQFPEVSRGINVEYALEAVRKFKGGKV